MNRLEAIEKAEKVLSRYHKLTLCINRDSYIKINIVDMGDFFYLEADKFEKKSDYTTRYYQNIRKKYKRESSAFKTAISYISRNIYDMDKIDLKEPREGVIVYTFGSNLFKSTEIEEKIWDLNDIQDYEEFKDRLKNIILKEDYDSMAFYMYGVLPSFEKNLYEGFSRPIFFHKREIVNNLNIDMWIYHISVFLAYFRTTTITNNKE
jgi:hypothetical protein